jgi:hypothetical protein
LFFISSNTLLKSAEGFIPFFCSSSSAPLAQAYKSLPTPVVFIQSTFFSYIRIHIFFIPLIIISSVVLKNFFIPFQHLQKKFLIFVNAPPIIKSIKLKHRFLNFFLLIFLIIAKIS